MKNIHALSDDELDEAIKQCHRILKDGHIDELTFRRAENTIPMLSQERDRRKNMSMMKGQAINQIVPPGAYVYNKLITRDDVLACATEPLTEQQIDSVIRIVENNEYLMQAINECIVDTIDDLTKKTERDTVEWLSGIYEGMTKKELIDALNEIPLGDDTPVVVTCIGEDVQSGSDLYNIKVLIVDTINHDGRDGSETQEYKISIEAVNI